MDGRLGEWTHTGFDVLYPIEGSNAWQGLADASGIVWLAWDNTMLYLGAYIRDDTLVQRWKDDKIARGDSLTLRLSLTSALPDVWEVVLSPGDFNKNKPAAFITTADKKASKEIRVQAAPSSEGYTLEAAIPWQQTPVGVPEQSLLLRYALILQDNDNEKSDAPESRIANTSTLDVNDLRTYPTLQLLLATQ
ncbi:hypothetical protein ARMA_1892 [Ardenticatena maritima]|uniref:Carbohydrate-binding domain-containing protein n=1 Tax=Ardenticatena maritima TaxID=872965 RepID=A0A0M8K9Y4_9CHLR|nr:hypothetical protein ARMA_1892 [Ardenticatena maritima]